MKNSRGLAARRRVEVDLLTVLEHELGHVIGLSDNAQAGDLMDITLGLGVRRAPTAADLALIGQATIVAVTGPAADANARTLTSDRASGGEKRNEFRSTGARRPQPVLVNGSVSVASAAVDAALASISSAAAGTDDAHDTTRKRGLAGTVRGPSFRDRREAWAQDQSPQSPRPFRRLTSSLFPQMIRRPGAASGPA